jgi:hypothetical protein
MQVGCWMQQEWWYMIRIPEKAWVMGPKPNPISILRASTNSWTSIRD